MLKTINKCEYCTFPFYMTSVNYHDISPLFGQLVLLLDFFVFRPSVFLRKPAVPSAGQPSFIAKGR